MTVSKNNYASTNKEWWEKMAKEDCGFTKPWLDLDIKVLQKLAKGELKNFTFTQGEPIPEPSSMLLLGSGLIGLFGAQRKWKK